MRQQMQDMTQAISVSIHNLGSLNCLLLLFLKFSVGDKHILSSWTPIIELLWSSGSSFSPSDKKKIDKQNSDLLQSLAVALFAYFPSPHPTVPHCKCLLRVTASRFEGRPILTLPFFVRIKEVKILSGALRAGIWVSKKPFSHLRVPPQDSMLSISLQGRRHNSALHV